MLTTELPATVISIPQPEFFGRSLSPPSIQPPAQLSKKHATAAKATSPRPGQNAKPASSEPTPAKPRSFWPSVTPSANLIPVDELLVRRVIEEAEDRLDDVTQDDGPSADALLETSSDEPPSTFIAKRQMRLLRDDLSGNSFGEPDLFGHIEHDRETRKLDALIWMFGLNPDGAEMTFDWVCDELGQDPEIFRRVVAKNMRQELKRVLKILCGMVSLKHAEDCEITLSEYVHLKGWNLS